VFPSRNPTRLSSRRMSSTGPVSSLSSSVKLMPAERLVPVIVSVIASGFHTLGGLTELANVYSESRHPGRVVGVAAVIMS